MQITNAGSKAIDALYSSIAAAIEPTKPLDIIKWTHSNRILGSSSDSRIKGKFDYSRTPQMQAPANAWKEATTRRLVLMTSVQIGKTELVLNIIGTISTNDPSPILFILPTDELARDLSKGRVADLIKNSLADRYLPDSAKGQTVLIKPYAGGTLRISGGATPNKVSSHPAKYAIIDEADRVLNLKGEGDIIKLIEARTTSYKEYGSKILITSTPTLESSSRIYKEYKAGTQHKLYIKCQSCKDSAPITIDRLIANDRNNLSKGVSLACKKCGFLMDESEKMRLITAGEWRQTNPEPARGVVSYHIWAALNPAISWRSILEAFFESKEKPETLQTFYNTILGLPFQDLGAYARADDLLKQRESYTIDNLPNNIDTIVVTIDVQANRLECLLAGFSDAAFYGIDYKVFKSDQTPAVADYWLPARQWLDALILQQDNKRINLNLIAVDSGFATNDVYQFAPHLGRGRKPETMTIMIKGSSQPDAAGFNLPLMRPPQPPLYKVGTQQIKTQIDALMRNDNYNFNWNGNFTKRFFNQLTAERKQWSNGRMMWKNPTGKRNEALDLTVYAYHARAVVRHLRKKQKTINNNIK